MTPRDAHRPSRRRRAVPARAISRTGRPARSTGVIPFQRFLDEQRDVVWRFVVATVGRQEADDVFQETFLAAMSAYPRLRSESNLRGWVLTIAHRKSLDHFRARRRGPELPGEVPDIGDHDGDLADEELWAQVRALPPKQRGAITLRYAADLSHSEIAVALDCSEEAARRSLHEGLKKLRAEVTA
jgi:RNA polymerase sigma factor (sigma-70 family)